jgi:hypothetical protein
VHAQGDPEAEEAAEAEAASEGAADGDSDASAEPAPEAASSGAGGEGAGPRPWWFGAYFQTAFVPSFMLKLFLDDAPTVSSVGVGATVTHRNKDGMSLVFGIGYAGYGFEGPFRIAGDPAQDTEMLKSTLSLLHLRVQMLWSTEIVPSKLSFEYGVGLDLGVVLGELTRSEAYADAQGQYQACAAPGLAAAGVPNPLYCDIPVNVLGGTDAYDADGAHYNVVEKRVPPVMLIPMLPALALRFTPIPALAIKLDAAFGLMQLAVGLSASYAPEL